MPAPPRPPAYVVIGRIVKPHGLRGEVKVRPETDFPGRFAGLRRVHLLREEELRPAAAGEPRALPEPVAVETVRSREPYVLLKLAGTESPEAARELVGAALAVPWEERVPLEPGAYYVGEIVGLAVRTADGRRLGRISEVLRTAAHDLYRVEGASGELLLPATREVVRAVDLAEGEMVVALPAGLEARGGSRSS